MVRGGFAAPLEISICSLIVNTLTKVICCGHRRMLQHNVHYVEFNENLVQYKYTANENSQGINFNRSFFGGNFYDIW